MNANSMTQENYVFALDIGTRSIIGIVGWQEDDLFHVADTQMREHPRRAMIDGQIDDIQQVARIAGEVKSALEARVGFELTRVCVAAAGRALKTCQADFESDISSTSAVSEQQVYELELGAIQKARDQLAEENGAEHSFSCVGHSVTRYYLDDYPFTTIAGHRGKTARVEIIATFLPNEVVDSLCAAMSLIGCEIQHLTLEPIAAMNAVIPSELRLLNLALVDIGAGTSDIAISDKGSVAAYTMATVAGDEITEDIIRHYLVDFQTAEEMKRQAAQGESSISYHDILGFDYTITLDEILETLRPGVTRLSDIICERILECNGKAPAAVFLVGGGSLVPLLCDVTAEKLGVDRNKVAVGGNNFIKRVVRDDCGLTGPEYATPLGIAITSVAVGAQYGFHIYVNGKRIRLFRTEFITVMDALLMAGFQYSEIMGRGGKNITYRLNGTKTLVRGTHLQAAEIRVNGQQASITTPIYNEDSVDIKPAVNGEDAHVTIDGLGLTPAPIHIAFNGTPLEAGNLVLINGRNARPAQEIVDRDVIDTYRIETIADVCIQTGVAPQGKQFFVSGAMQGLDYKLQDGDAILCAAVDLDRLQSKDFAPKLVHSGERTEDSNDAQQAQPPVNTTNAAQETRPTQPDGNAVTDAVTAISGDPVGPGAESVEQNNKLFDPRQKASQAQFERQASEPIARPAAPGSTTAKVGTPAPASQPVANGEIMTAKTQQSDPLMSPDHPVALSGSIDDINAAIRSLKGETSTNQQKPESQKPDTGSQPQGAPAQKDVEQGGTVLVKPLITAPRTIKVTVNDRTVTLEQKPGGGSYEFIDMLNYVDIDPTKPQGNIILRLNGHEASYLEPIRHNDVVEIRWES